LTLSSMRFAVGAEGVSDLAHPPLTASPVGPGKANP
jgi:hypothetical protein